MSNQGTQSIKQNMVMSILLTLSNAVFPLLTYTYVARVLLPSGIGKVSFATSIVSTVASFASIGIPNYGIRETSKNRDHRQELSKLVHELLIINFISVMFSYCLLGFLLFQVTKFQEYAALIKLLSTTLILNMIGIEWLYQGLELYRYITLRSITFKAIGTILIFILVRSEGDYLSYAALTVFMSSASYVLNFIHSRKYISYQYCGRYELKKHLKPIFYMLSSSIIIHIYTNFDIFFIGYLKTDAAVGMYNSGLKIRNMILALSTGITSVLIPRMSYYFKKNNQEQIRRLALKSLKISLLITVPIVIFVFFHVSDILILLCGAEYLPSKYATMILTLCCIPLILTSLFGNQLLIPEGKEKKYTQSVLGGLMINLTFNLIMIPFLGILGAALSTFLTELFNAVYMGVSTKEKAAYLLKNCNWRNYLCALFLSLIISNYVFLNFNFYFALFSKALVFICVYYLFLYLTKEELIHELIKNQIKKLHVPHR